MDSAVSLKIIGGGSDVVSVSCFGVRVSVMFHFMFVHYTFSSVGLLSGHLFSSTARSAKELL